MMKRLFVTLMMFGFTSISNGQIGEGVIRIASEFFNQGTIEIKIYENKGDNAPLHTLRVTGDYITGFIAQEPGSSWLNPEYFDLEYQNIIFRYEMIEDGWKRVIYDKVSGSAGWISTEIPVTIHSWGDFLTNETTSVDPLGIVDVKAGPDENSKTLRETSSLDCFEAIGISGDWIKIRTNQTLDCSQHPYPIEGGFIRWRDGNNLLIKYGLGC